MLALSRVLQLAGLLNLKDYQGVAIQLAGFLSPNSFHLFPMSTLTPNSQLSINCHDRECLFPILTVTLQASTSCLLDTSNAQHSPSIPTPQVPSELLMSIASHLSKVDLCNLRLVKKSFADTGATFLFQSIKFHASNVSYGRLAWNSLYKSGIVNECA